MQPSLAWGDGIRLQREAISGESFILVELSDIDFAPDPLPFARLGVAAWDHPLYVMAGYSLVRLLPGVNALWLVNLLSALFGAGAIALVFQLCYRQTGSLMGSLFAALALAVSHTFWWHAATPEVYTFFAFWLLLAVYGHTVYEDSGRAGALFLAAFALGLAASTHLLAFLAVPALLIYHLLKRKGCGGSSRHSLFFSSFILFLLGFSPYLIQFLRLLRTFSVGEIMGPAVGVTFLRSLLATTPLLLGQSLGLYLLLLLLQFGPLGFLLGLYGWKAGAGAYGPLWRRSLALFMVYALFGVLYRVSDQFAFFLVAHIFWAVAMGMGVATLEKRLARPRRRQLAALLGALVVAMPLVYAALPGLARSAGMTDASLGVPQVGAGVRDGLAYYMNPNKRGDWAAYNFGQETLAQLPPNALVLAEWYVDTDEYFVLRYFMAIEGRRPDVEVAGWPRQDPFTFDSSLAVAMVEAALPERPLFLASLSPEFYDAPRLLARYCLVTEANLYRVYPSEQAAGRACLR